MLSLVKALSVINDSSCWSSSYTNAEEETEYVARLSKYRNLYDCSETPDEDTYIVSSKH